MRRKHRKKRGSRSETRRDGSPFRNRDVFVPRVPGEKSREERRRSRGGAAEETGPVHDPRTKAIHRSVEPKLQKTVKVGLVVCNAKLQRWLICGDDVRTKSDDDVQLRFGLRDTATTADEALESITPSSWVWPCTVWDGLRWWDENKRIVDSILDCVLRISKCLFQSNCGDCFRQGIEADCELLYSPPRNEV